MVFESDRKRLDEKRGQTLVFEEGSWPSIKITNPPMGESTVFLGAS